MTTQQDVRPTDRYVSLFGDLMRDVREQGLLERRYLYYWTHITLTVGAFAAIWVGFFLLGAQRTRPKHRASRRRVGTERGEVAGQDVLEQGQHRLLAVLGERRQRRRLASARNASAEAKGEAGDDGSAHASTYRFVRPAPIS